jgi:transcriptional regulator with XRE-family HTH domain
VRCPYPNRWKCTQVAPKEPKTIGEHIKKRRLALHLLQADLAKRLGVHWGSIQNWERGATQPAIRHLPAIIKFLGYDAVREPQEIPARIAYGRRRLGLTQEELAKALGIDTVTLWRWESGKVVAPNKARAVINSLFKAINLLL